MNETIAKFLTDQGYGIDDLNKEGEVWAVITAKAHEARSAFGHDNFAETKSVVVAFCQFLISASERASKKRPSLDKGEVERFMIACLVHIFADKNDLDRFVNGSKASPPL